VYDDDREDNDQAASSAVPSLLVGTCTVPMLPRLTHAPAGLKPHL
jgi:hypothetical protein